MKLHTYVNFPGNCEKALDFYQQHLGATVLTKMTFGQSPDQTIMHPGMEKNILHARFRIGDTELMASDGPGVEPMRSAYLSLSVDSNEEAERVFAALSEGGEVFMPMAETFFAHRFAMLRDQFGLNWMVIHDRPMSG